MAKTPNKNKQLKIILKNNPMRDNYHVGIRTLKNIKTFRQAVKNAKQDPHNYGFNYSDFGEQDAKSAIKKGVIVVHSSKPIKPGNFVATSLRNAQDYAGSGKVHSKKVRLTSIAWINVDEGQYTGTGKKKNKVVK